ncbi:hypothetical protein BLA60_35230 [Actinophytocola xinjiangensis]|uniref:Fumarylacetoacetase-like C-terminal domain-containing protein n=1 Tax=Actinophytocola xinjiangensis TaxID=485602 RepID=A0A7Z1AVJ2_9PSEU|nr:fumarylacetoacetate hydrolase family protein [Actinophytocola xinjiangensis]OLF05763.1 hypothetical protein BLA60_35230 [Actinophytocola xinjiangensis]
MSHPLGISPSKIIAVHLNFRSRAAERGRVPEVPSYFLKPPSSLAADGDDIVRPAGAELLTYEGEIAVVIGTRARNVPRGRAAAHIGWFTASNDVGLHDLRAADRGSNLRSKGSDGFTPLGPSLVDASTVDPATLRLRTWVNGRLVQDTGTDDMIFDFDHLVADLSRTITLEPGDVILTGTPTGAGIVLPGDVVEVELSGAGRLTNTVVAGPRLAAFGATPTVSDEARAVAGKPATQLPAPTGTPAPGRPDGLSAATAHALSTVATATLSVQLRKRGLNEVFLAGVRPAHPGQRMLGRARTLRYLPLREDVFERIGGGMNAQKRAVESLRAGDVLVIECRGEPGAGTMGDILATRAQVLGATGIVTDGALRDTEAVRALDIPTYYGGSHASVLGRRHVPAEVDVPVACGGTLVEPGDVLVGDGDGVVVIPPALVDEVAAAALAQEREEEFVLARIRAGASVDGWYPMNAAARAEYEHTHPDHGKAI